jgi:hypothetical protein
VKRRGMQRKKVVGNESDKMSEEVWQAVDVGAQK